MSARSAASEFECSLFLCFSALFICIAPSLGQTPGTGALTGTVTDPSGAVIVGATVTATDLSTNQERTVTTDAAGTYRFGLLPAGSYKLSFSASRFGTVEIPTIAVATTESRVLNQALRIGAETQKVTVEANTERLQTQNATVGTLVGSKELTDLPLSGRNYTQIIDLSPGVVANVATASTVGNGTRDVNVNGSGSNQNNYIMDGASQTNYGSGGAAQSGNFPGIGIPNPDSIQEFRIQTSQYDAGYGRNPGASVSVVTKGGTNFFHGAAWEFFRNSFLDGNDKFNKAGQVTLQEPNKPQALNQNEFGGALGGPIKKDKLFFFGSYQGLRQKNGIGSSGFGTGISSDLTLLPFNEPDGTRADEASLVVPFRLQPGGTPCPAPTYRRYLGCVFSGDRTFRFIPGFHPAVATDGNNINLVAVNVLRALGPKGGLNGGFYVPSMPFGSNGLPVCNWDTTNCAVSISVPIIASENQYLGNGDWVVNNKNTFSERYFFSKDPQVQSFVCPNVFSSANQCTPGQPEDATYTATNGVLKLASVLTSNLVNDAHFGFQRQTVQAAPANYISACSVLIIPVLNAGSPCPEKIPSADPTLNQIPTFSIGGFGETGGGGWNNGGSFGVVSVKNFFNTFQGTDNLSWSRGKHTIRTGFEYERIQFNWNFPWRGGEGFLTTADFLISSSGLPDTGTPPAGGLLVLNLEGFGPPNGSKHYSRVNGFSAYVQDDIRVSSKLTVNLGVRWEYDGWPSDAKGVFTNLWASQAALVNTGSFFLGNQVSAGPGTPANQVGTLAGFVVQSNYNPSALNCGTYTVAAPCGYTAPPNVFLGYVGGATGVYTNTNKTLLHGFPPYAFAPRFGFAWQPLGDKMVLRAGYGIFYDKVYGNLLTNNLAINGPSGSNITNTFSQSLDNPVPVPGTLGWNPRTLEVLAGDNVNGATVIQSLDGGQGIQFGASRDSEWLSVPLIQEYNVDLQYQIGHDWVADVGYVGTHGMSLYDWNRPINVALLMPDAPNAPTDPQNVAMVLGSGVRGTPSSIPFNDVNNTNPSTRVHENLVSNVAGRVSYLGFSTAGLGTTGTDGDSLYNSLQASLKHQFASGFFLQASYTYSKLITNVNAPISGHGISAPGNVLSGTAGSNDPLNMAQQYGLAAWNRPHRFVVAYSYNIPRKHTEGFSGKVLSGWTLSGVTTIQDGSPFTIVDSTGGGIYYGLSGGGVNLPLGWAVARAQLASTGHCNSLGVCHSMVPIATSGSNNSRLNSWINPAAFTAPPCIGGTPNPGGSPAFPCGDAPNGLFPGDPGYTFVGAGTGWGNSAVGSISGPGQHNWDFSITKNTSIKENITFQFRSEFYNLWNHPQFNPPNNNFAAFNPNPAFNQFGVITSSSVPPRVVQFGVKLLF